MAKKLIDPADCPKCMPEWLASFGDLMSLLLCFFVLLLSMSTMDAKKLEAAVGSLSGALGILEGGVKPDVAAEQNLDSHSTRNKEQVESKKQMENTIKSINELLNASGSPEITLDESEDGFIIRLPASLLFEKGKAVLENEDALLFLKRISMVIAKLPDDITTDIVGHTDNETLDSDSIYKNNWELSSARALSVVDELIKDGVLPRKLMASAKGEFEPFASNATQQGRDKNNRVEIRFISLDTKARNATKKSILDQGF
jgi:ompA/motB